MNVQFQNQNNLTGKLTITITPEDFMPGYEKILKKYNKETRVPGFRPGFVPKGMIEKMYGEKALFDEINHLTSKAINDYINENKLDVIGHPISSKDQAPYPQFEKSGSYTFVFDLGLSPEFNIDIKGAGSFKKIHLSVDEKMLDEEMKHIQSNYGNMTYPETSESEDMVRLDLKELNDQDEILEGGVDKEVNFLISYIKDQPTKELVTGVKKGDTFKVNIFNLFNDDHKEMEQSLGVAHQVIHDMNKQFQAKVVEISRMAPAELNQELFDKVLGPGAVSSLEEFKERISKDITVQFEPQGHHLLTHELMDAVLAHHQFELPEEFLKRWLIESHPDQYNTDNVDEKFASEAKGLRWQLIKEKIQKDHEVQVDMDQVKEAAIRDTYQMLSQYGLTRQMQHLVEEIASKNLKKEEYVRNMYQHALADAVMNKMVELADVHDEYLDSDTFFAIIRQHNEQHHHNHDHGHDHSHDHENQPENTEIEN